MLLSDDTQWVICNCYSHTGPAEVCFTAARSTQVHFVALQAFTAAFMLPGSYYPLQSFTFFRKMPFEMFWSSISPLRMWLDNCSCELWYLEQPAHKVRPTDRRHLAFLTVDVPTPWAHTAVEWRLFIPNLGPGFREQAKALCLSLFVNGMFPVSRKAHQDVF